MSARYKKTAGLELIEDPVPFHYAAPHMNPPAEPVVYASSEFLLAYARVCEAAGARNMRQLADFFRVSLSKVSEVQHREKIPVVWLYHLLLTRRVSPQWIVYGTGPRILELADVVDETGSAHLLRQALA